MRGLTPGHVRLSLAIETPRGLLAAREIAGASDRIATMSVGVEDYCLELGVEPSPDGAELLYAVSTIVTLCKATGITPTGLVGSIAGFRDIAVFEGAAQRRGRDRGAAFYGDERQKRGLQELFDEKDAQRAVQNLEFVAKLSERLLTDAPS